MGGLLRPARATNFFDSDFEIVEAMKSKMVTFSTIYLTLSVITFHCSRNLISHGHHIFSSMFFSNYHIGSD